MTKTFNDMLKIQPKKLGALLDDEEGDVLWSADDLGAICRHQLNVPIRFELGSVSPEQAQIIENVADSKDLLLKSFRALLTHPLPPVRLLKMTKDFSKKHLSSKANLVLPREIAAVLYYSSIAVACVRCRRKISKLSLHEIQQGIQWSLQQVWLDPQIAQVLTECQNSLSRESTGTGEPS